MIRIFFLLTLGFLFAQVEPQEVDVPQIDSISKVGELPMPQDSLSQSQASQETFQDIIDYVSEEQYFDVQNEKTYLVTDAVIKYLDMEIMADYIEIDLKTGDIYAVGKQDSTGKVIASSKFKQGGRELEYGSFTYNIKTKRGKAFNIRTEESIGNDKGVVVAGVVKQYNDSVSGMRKIAYTTDEYYIARKDSIADYHLEAEVGKMIRGKENTIITGPIVMKIYDITTPLALPFAFLPSGSKRSAGILLPSFGERENLGFYLQGLGIYLPIGEYVDLAFTADIYTKGSLGFNALSNYKVRYKYAGNFNFDWNRNVRGIKGLSDYNKSTVYNLRWNHRQDTKANPNLTFNAQVNLQSSKFYQNAVDNYGIRNGSYLNNNVNSSITVTKNWPNSPFNASLYLNHYQKVNPQNEDAGTITMQLPNLSVNMSRVYPFSPKNGPKKGLLQSMSMNYQFQMRNEINTTEDEFLKAAMFDDTKTAAKNTLSFNTGTTVFNYFPLTFGANYDEVWTLNSINRYYDPTLDEVIDEDINGFKSYRTFDTRATLSTTLYGTKIFGAADDDKMIKAIRHMVTPSVSFGYRPDFKTDRWGYYDTYLDGDNNEVDYSVFNTGVFPLSSGDLQENMSFSIGNNLELKVRDRESDQGVKKIKIFESLNITSGYNFAADSLQLSPIRINGRSSLFNNKLSLNFSATIEPYKISYSDTHPNGVKINEIGDFNFTNYSLRTSYSFNQDFFGQRELNYDTRGQIRYEDFFFDSYRYAQFLTPWNLNVDLSHRVSTSSYGDKKHSTTIGMSGSISPTPHWAISGRASFDVQALDFNATYLTFSRDLRSFIIDFGMNPMNPYKTWNFFIGIKANFLRETLKYEEKNFRSFNNNL